MFDVFSTQRFSFSLLLSLLLITACGGGSESTPQVQDTIAPVISLSGANPQYHEQGTDYTDPGATASDNTDGTVAVTVTGSVGVAAGTYTLTYSATDAAGNEASVSRQVIVQDTTAPDITLIGNELIIISVGDSFTEPGATATDLADGSLPVEISGEVDTLSAGDYLITYTATDQAGNSAQRNRTVRVIESNTPPADSLVVLDNGIEGQRWEEGINAFDAALNYQQCNNDGGAACPSISWQTTEDAERGTVLQVSHAVDGQLAGLFVKTNVPVDLTDYRAGALLFDVRLISGDENFTMKLDCVYPCTSGDHQLVLPVTSTWQTMIAPLSELETAGLNLTQVDTGIVIWASSHQNTIYLLDNVRFISSYSGDSSITPQVDTPLVEYNLTTYGAGTVSDTINPAGYRCVYDYGNWIYNAGIVEPGIAGCDTSTGTPVGEPTPRYPQVTAAAAAKPVASHRWWGSVSFHGEMAIGNTADAAHITPDPIIARVNDRGFRMMGIPAGLTVRGENDFGHVIPDPFAEVFDGIAIANSNYTNLNAYVADYSDGSVTVEWQASGVSVMQATFVHGSPYVYLTVYEGQLLLKTLRADGGEKGIFYQGARSLGIWTNVAGNLNHYLISGEGDTTFTDINSSQIGASNSSSKFSIALLPATGTPSTAMINDFQQSAHPMISRVLINYLVNQSDQSVTISHDYLDDAGNLVNTLIGMQPLHWKNQDTAVSSDYQIRSARGVTKFINGSGFSYTLPFVGVLPALPTFMEDLDMTRLQSLVTDYMSQGPTGWNRYEDTYWSGKSYGKAAEVIAIADAIGMTTERDQLLSWLKTELVDWFNAERNNDLDTKKYFVYDDTWNTLLGMEESFAAHQQLNDHHFHYGYFVRAAAEICRHELDWCQDQNYGAMVKLLIRDYAGGRDDPLFPYLRHFDPANGFSWASGNVNFVRGNNNESTSEAANAYGAMVLFGLAIGDQSLIDRGIYLHASTSASFWEYWNNIDGYRGATADENNFPDGYNRITTSIVWGDGAVFATWFSAAYAHILGIQGLPSNPLTLHVGQYADYLHHYVQLGMTESSNGNPSGLVPDQWRDLWWNIWALTDPEASIVDYLSVVDYQPEEGESKAHTYHWLYSMQRLGSLATGTGQLAADYPGAIAFTKGALTNYVIYNFGDTARTVRFTDGTEVNAQPNSFTVQEQ